MSYTSPLYDNPSHLVLTSAFNATDHSFKNSTNGSKGIMCNLGRNCSVPLRINTVIVFTKETTHAFAYFSIPVLLFTLDIDGSRRESLSLSRFLRALATCFSFFLSFPANIHGQTNLKIFRHPSSSLILSLSLSSYSDTFSYFSLLQLSPYHCRPFQSRRPLWATITLMNTCK